MSEEGLSIGIVIVTTIVIAILVVFLVYSRGMRKTRRGNKEVYEYTKHRTKVRPTFQDFRFGGGRYGVHIKQGARVLTKHPLLSPSEYVEVELIEGVPITFTLHAPSKSFPRKEYTFVPKKSMLKKKPEEVHAHEGGLYAMDDIKPLRIQFVDVEGWKKKGGVLIVGIKYAYQEGTDGMFETKEGYGVLGEWNINEDPPPEMHVLGVEDMHITLGHAGSRNGYENIDGFKLPRLVDTIYIRPDTYISMF